jgi:hypothetical protein
MADMKHIGRTVNRNRKCLVAYRVIPNDPEHCLVVFTDNLEAADHDSLINLVGSNTAQTAYELAEAMARVTLSDGRNMLAGLSHMGKLSKVPTNEIEMVPSPNTSVNLAELNRIIAEQRGVTVADLAVKPSETEAAATKAVVAEAPVVAAIASEPLTDEVLASQYRSQADAMYKEAKRLREEAEALSPTKKKTTKSEQSA